MQAPQSRQQSGNEQISTFKNQLSRDIRKIQKYQPLKKNCTIILEHVFANRIFYFILLISLLVLVAVIQVKLAYTNYQDNQRLVKLWIRQKQLKDAIKEKDANLQKQQSLRKVDQDKMEQVNKTSSKTDMLQNSNNSLKLQSEEKDQDNDDQLKSTYAQSLSSPLKNQRSVRSRGQRVRPTAGISYPQSQAAKRWIQMNNQKQMNITTQVSQQQKKYYEDKYSFSSFQTQIPFCIVVPSFNNVQHDRHIRNIRSIIMQNYSNYHIVFIDDASTDGTGTEVFNFLKKQNIVPRDRYQVIQNIKQQMAMANLRFAAKQKCKPQQIFLIVDGDDQLIGRHVLKLYNSVFQKQGAWFIYSNFLTPRGNIGYSRPIPQKVITSNSYRSYPFVTSHLRAYYTQLFLNIREEDLKDDNGQYFKAANDVAICIPILQMSHKNVYYLKQITYFYNSMTGQNNHQLRIAEQKKNALTVGKRKSYQPLSNYTQILINSKV